MRVFSVATSAAARISIEHNIRHMHAPGYERDSKASPRTFVEFHDGLWPAQLGLHKKHAMRLRSFKVSFEVQGMRCPGKAKSGRSSKVGKSAIRR